MPLEFATAALPPVRVLRYNQVMNRIDVHSHFLPATDDGCQNLVESLECLRIMAQNGYDRIFCTPHMGATEFRDVSNGEVSQAVQRLQTQASAVDIKVTLRPGGEIRLTCDLPEHLRDTGIPTYGLNSPYCLVDLWDHNWPPWANRAVEWLQKQNLRPILAHPERMPVIRANPRFIHELARLGLMFQGNLGPLGGSEAPDITAIAEKFLLDGHYFMLGSDSHRPHTMAVRMNGLFRAEQLVGAERLHELTIKNPSLLWV